MTIVLVTNGKQESVNYASVHVFNSESAAMAFCLTKNSGSTKYWTKAEIVGEGESIELNGPEEE